MKLFIIAMLWLLRHEIKYARGTGRNPENIQQLSREIADYELDLLNLELGELA